MAWALTHSGHDTEFNLAQQDTEEILAAAAFAYSTTSRGCLLACPCGNAYSGRKPYAFLWLHNS